MFISHQTKTEKIFNFANMKRQFLTSFVLLIHIALATIVVGALITFFSGKHGTVHLRQDSTHYYIYELNEGGSERLPFRLSLEQFTTEYYSDSVSPKDYISRITVSPLTDNDAPFTATVSMNRPFTYDGYTFCQAGFDDDGLGATLLVSHDPWGEGVTYTGYALLGIGMWGFFLLRLPRMHRLLTTQTIQPKRYPIAMLGAVCIGGIVLTGIMLTDYVSPSAQPIPVLRSPLLSIHIATIILAYSILFFPLLCGLIAITLHFRNNREREVMQLQTISRITLYPAVFLLASGIFIGAVWANQSWGRYWGWDPKETWALITLLVYSIPLHKSSQRLLRSPIAFHIFCICAFLCVLMTYFGVNWLLGGIHSYG